MLSAETLLRVWERGHQSGPAERALDLLALAAPDHDRETLASFDLGLRDWHLMRLQLAWFGPVLAGCTDCPGCGERLEIELDASAIGAESTPEPAPLFTSKDGRRFRVPTVGDLLTIAAERGERAVRLLFERCSLDDLPAGHESEALFAEVDAGVEALARVRGIHVNVSCAPCGEDSRHYLDPTEFLWSEIATHAGALLDAVHRLAHAYGWSEREILAMSGARRAAYLSRLDR